MIPSSLTLVDEQIIQSMIELARCSKSHRIIMAGSKGSEHMFELHRRGYTRVSTTATCGPPRGQYDVALIDWQLQSIKALETTLDWLVHFLAPTSVLVVSVDSSKRTDNQKLAPMLERLGFRIEAGTRCEQGFVISARRRDAAQMAVAA
jgi:hypothetical protein